MEQIELAASQRNVLGKKVRFLRRQGITPVNLFGRGLESTALQCDTTSLRRVVAEAGQTRLINLKLASEKGPRMVMVRQIQIEPRTGETLHVDLYQVRMAERIKVEVPVILCGDAPALKIKENTLIQALNTLTIESLPGKIPDRIEVDCGVLTESNKAIRVKDINLEEGIAILNNPELVIGRISTRVVEVEKVEKVVAEAAEAAETAAQTEEEAKEGE